jgi:hypothetical protein
MVKHIFPLRTTLLEYDSRAQRQIGDFINPNDPTQKQSPFILVLLLLSNIKRDAL